MPTTLDEARGIVRGLFGSRQDARSGFGSGLGRRGRRGARGRPGIRLPEAGGRSPDDQAPADSDTKIKPPTFNEAGGDRYVMGVEEAADRVAAGTYTGRDIAILKDAGILTADEASDLLFDMGTDGAGGGGGSDDRVGFGNLAARNAEERRRIFENERDYSRSIFESDRGFQADREASDRGELAQRAGSGMDFLDTLLNLQTREDDLAKDPGNFPAYLANLQGTSGQMPYLQELVGEGVAIPPAEARYLNDPRTKQIIDSLFNYSRVPSSGDVDRVRQAYDQDPDAARRWFEAASAMDQGGGMAQGGSFQTRGPMRFQDLTTGATTRIAGEAGPETVTVTPQRFGTAGTFGALAKSIRAGGFGSEFPADVLARLEEGMAPRPGDVPDWILKRLLPSQRELLGAGILAQLGGAGAKDFDFTRGLYEAKGFSGAGGVVR